MVICLNYGHFEKKMRSVIVSKNHYLNQILDIHPLTKFLQNSETWDQFIWDHVLKNLVHLFTLYYESVGRSETRTNYYGLA